MIKRNKWKYFWQRTSSRIEYSQLGYLISIYFKEPKLELKIEVLINYLFLMMVFVLFTIFSDY